MSGTIYFDNAATSFPKPKAVYDRMDKFLREEAANPGRSGHRMAVETEAVIQRTRANLAKLLNVKDPKNIVFTLNCTDSLNIAMKGLLRQGDHVITSFLEHNSVTRPLNALEKEGVITLTRVAHSKDGYLNAQDIQKALRPDTRLVVLTHASNVIGTVQPIREIAKTVHEHSKALLLVDGAQTVGGFPVDVEADGIDLLAFPGHKALFGPAGTGALYVSGKVKLSPWREGGTGADSTAPIQPEEMPFALEAGTPNTVGIAGLGAGIDFVTAEGVSKIHAREMKLVESLRKELSQIPGITLYGSPSLERSVAALSLNIQGIEPQEVGAILDQSFGIAVRPGLHCAPLIHQTLGTFPSGCIRLSPGYFNTEEEAAKVAAAVRQIQKEFVSA